MKLHHIQLPAADSEHLSQNEAFFYLLHEDGTREKISFHSYGRIYQTPGLYEQIFYDRLRCRSPKVVTDILHKAVENSKEYFTELRVMDFGAGNGLMGEALNKYGVARLVGVDIAVEAKQAAMRDRPGVYDEFYVKDFLNLSDKDAELFKEWSFDCLTTVAALGFGDIPVRAFFQAINLISERGWVAFNIKESFLQPSDQSGFSKFIRQLILSEHMQVHYIERYKHRLSIEGVPLYYYAIVARKNSHIPEELLGQRVVLDPPEKT